MCIASPNAAAMGDAATAAFRRKLRRYRREIEELSVAHIAFRPLVWTADGRPHPAATRTLRYAAEIAASRNGQEASPGTLVSRWKHEIQVAILRRRGAMARAVLPKATAQEQWLLTGRSDRSEHVAQVPLLGEDDFPEFSRVLDDDDDENLENESGDGMET